MSFYMNPFTSDYIGNMVLADRKQVIEFKCPQNWGRGPNFVVAWLPGPYDVSTTYKTLTLQVAIDNDFRNWTTLSFDLSAGATTDIPGTNPAVKYIASAAAATTIEIANYLNSLTGFSAYFTATAIEPPLFSGDVPRLKIKQKFQETRMKFYVNNTSFERLARFNARAGVSELPTYFDRHSVANLGTFTDGVGAVVKLDASAPADQLVITNAVDNKNNNLGLVYSSPQADWQLLAGKSGAFNCQIITLDVTSRVTTIIEFQTGAKVGDLARKIEYYYAGSNASSNPNGVYEIPFVLTQTQIDTVTTDANAKIT